MKIEKIVSKNDNTVIVHFAEGEKLFLSKELVIKNGLSKGDQITDEISSLLINENQLFFIRQRAFSYLGRRQHSRYELLTKLKKKGYELNLIKTILDALSNKKYLNDYNFAIAFAKDKKKFKHFGKYKIKSELHRRGVDREFVDKVINEIFPDGNDITEAVYHLNKKTRNISKEDFSERKTKDKLFAFLNQKGFDYDTSREAIKIIEKEIEE